MPCPAFSLANLMGVDGRQRARDLSLPVSPITGSCNGRALPDLRKVLADLRRRHDPYDPAMERMASKLGSLGPPE